MFIFHQSTAMRAGLYTFKSDTRKHLSSATFIFCLFPCSSQGQQPRFRYLEFLSILVRIRFTSCRCCDQPTAKTKKKAMRRKKGKQIWYMKKRKQAENGKTPGSEQPVMKSVCGSLTMRRRAASPIIVHHHTSLNAQPSSWREFGTTKGPLCMNTASRLRR